MAEEDKKQEKDMQKEYEKIRVKYSLPSFNDLDKEFTIGTLEQSNFVLKEIMSKLSERCSFALKLLGTIIQPENHLSDMQEAEHLPETEKKKVLDLFNKLSYIDRDFIIMEFDYDEEKSAELIKRYCKEWLAMKQDFLDIIHSLRDTWKIKDKKSQDYAYFG